MIHVCFAVHDKNGNYAKYAGVAIVSLLENTSVPVVVHILHDKSLSVGTRLKFKYMVHSYQQNIVFHFVDNVQMPKEIIEKYTIGALLRLKLLELLDVSVEKIIYFDADTVVNLDINSLWEQPFKGKLILARKDAENRNLLMERKVLNAESYVNSGVMVWDIRRMRELHPSFFEEVLQFFSMYPEAPFPDQDAINYIFAGEIGFVDSTYNRFTVELGRNSLPRREENVIYHFAGDRVQIDGKAPFDQLFEKYLQQTPWADVFWALYKERVVAMKEELAWKNQFVQRLAAYPKAFWGTRGKINPAIMDKFLLQENDCYIDNNAEFWEQELNGHKIHAPQFLLENKAYVIIVTTLRFAEVKKQLEEYGYCEDIHFFDGRKLLLPEEGGYVKPIKWYP